MRLFRGDDTSQWLERYGDGHDGALTINSNTTYDGARAGATGTQGQYTLTVDDASSFADGDCIHIIQERGSGAGNQELNRIVSGGGTTNLTLKYPLDFTYDSSGNNKAQVVEMKEYSSVQIDATYTWSAPTWDGVDGGRISILVNGTLNFAGTISASGKGFDGHGTGAPDAGDTGEGTGGGKINNTTTPNGNAGGGGDGGGGSGGSGGGGGGYAGGGGNGTQRGSVNPGLGGSGVGTAGNITAALAGAGGSGGGDGSASGGGSGNGAGGLFIIAKTITQDTNGTIVNNGGNGSGGSGGNTGCGGGGAGGPVTVKCQSATLGTTKITSSGGSGGSGTGVSGGGGSQGQIHIDIADTDNLSGTTSPTLTSREDEYLSDLYAHEGTFSPGKSWKSVVRRKRHKENRSHLKRLKKAGASAISTDLVSKSLDLRYNISSYVSNTVHLVYSILRKSAQQSYTGKTVDKNTWVESDPSDPSQRRE